MTFIRVKNKNLGEQTYKLRKIGFEVVLTRLKLIATGFLQPTARSRRYKIEVKYSLNGKPEVRVLSPEIVKNFKGEEIPHVYPGKRLCLYRPLYEEFHRSDFIADTIIPWTSLWLYYYEVWHLTGEWKGGGEHVSIDKKIK